MEWSGGGGGGGVEQGGRLAQKGLRLPMNTPENTLS